MRVFSLILADDLALKSCRLPARGGPIDYPNDLAQPGCDETDITAVIVKNDAGREVDLIDVLTQEAINQLAADALQEIHDLEEDR